MLFLKLEDQPGVNSELDQQEVIQTTPLTEEGCYDFTECLGLVDFDKLHLTHWAEDNAENWTWLIYHKVRELIYPEYPFLP